MPVVSVIKRIVEGIIKWIVVSIKWAVVGVIEGIVPPIPVIVIIHPGIVIQTEVESTEISPVSIRPIIVVIIVIVVVVTLVIVILIVVVVLGDDCRITVLVDRYVVRFRFIVSPITFNKSQLRITTGQSEQKESEHERANPAITGVGFRCCGCWRTKHDDLRFIF